MLLLQEIMIHGGIYAPGGLGHGRCLKTLYLTMNTNILTYLNILLIFLLLTIYTLIKRDIDKYRLKTISKEAYYIYIIALTIIATIAALILFFLNEPQFNYRLDKEHAINLLNKMGRSQMEYYSKNGKFAESFMELGYSDYDLNSGFTFYLDNDRLTRTTPFTMPQYILIEKSKIYAVFNSREGNDVISVDYKGKIDILDDANIWPILEPKWHEWK